MTPKDAIKNYQCPGCVSGPYPKCYKTNENLACDAHCAGASTAGGRFFLGLPKGFCRLGSCDSTKIYIFKDIADGWGYSNFNVPVWKHLDKHGNTIVRGMCPRLNDPWIHIFLGDFINDIKCIEITSKDIASMD